MRLLKNERPTSQDLAFSNLMKVMMEWACTLNGGHKYVQYLRDSSSEAASSKPEPEVGK
jgi:hypothetical protein